MRDSMPIVLVVVCDNHFSVMLCALIQSIEASHSGEDPIELFIVDDHLSVDCKKKISLSVTRSFLHVHWLPLKKVIPGKMHIPCDLSLFPKNIHARLFIPYFIPEHFEKVLYLDVDTILNRDIADLWHTDIGSAALGAVQDPLVPTFGHKKGIRNFKALKLSPETRYLNSGLLLFNTKKWRDNHFTEKIVACIEQNKPYANYPDQYGINVVMANQWVPLDHRWNVFPYESCQDPYLIHFIGRKPIYSDYKNLPSYSALFWSYLKNTPWHDYRPKGRLHRYCRNLHHLISKIPCMLIHFSN